MANKRFSVGAWGVGVSLAGLALGPAAAAAPAAARTAPAARAAVTAWGVPATDVVADPAIRYGRLANGLRYAIRHNDTPKGTASVRLRIGLGSIGESDTERGLAHFIEHMAFNGTTHVPEGEMVRILERQGLAFGPDTNAQTGFDSTTYMLDLPATDAAHLDTALFLMREIASEVKFDPAAVQRERGVIEGERRARSSVQLRYITSLLNFQAPDAPYGKRLPIGLTPVIMGTPADHIANLYHRYYRPENATLVIVGDVDPVAIEAQIRAKFGDWHGTGPAGARLPRGTVDLSRGAAFGSFVDKTMPSTASLSIVRPYANPADTIAERNCKLVRSVAAAMLNNRLARIASAPGSVLLGGSMSIGEVKGAALTTAVTLAAKDGEWNAALATAEQEVRRARVHGFTKAEYDEVMSNIATAIATEAATAATRRNQTLAAAILATIDDNDFVTTPAWRLAQYKAFAPTLTLDQVNAEFRNLWDGGQPLVYISAKTPVGPPPAIAAAFATSSAVATPALADEGAVKFAYDSFGTAGKVVADQRIAAAGVRTIRFANNVRLNIKKTDFEQGRVRFEVRLGGGQLALPQDKIGLNMLMTMTSQLGGTGRQSMNDLKRLMAGKVVTPGAAVTGDAFVAAGATTPGDLALQMKLSAAYLTDPGYRPEALNQWNNLIPILETELSSQPAGVAGAQLPAVLANDDPRFAVPPAAVLNARSFAEAKAAYAPIAASAPIDIGIVGDIDEDAAIAAVAQSFGALPMRSATLPDYDASRVARFRTSRAPVTLTHNGSVNQAMVVAAWPTDDDRDPARVAQLGLLSSALQIMLIDKVREELGDSYGASVSSNMSNVYRGFGVMTASAVVAPDKIDEVRNAIEAAAVQLRSAPIPTDLLIRARNPALDRADRALRENAAWTDAVTRAQTEPARLDRLMTMKARIAAITPAQLQAAAAKYLVPAQRLDVRIVSARTPPIRVVPPTGSAPIVTVPIN